jgi:hypothetical protein
MPWLPKGDNPCETCWYRGGGRCHCEFACSDSPQRKRRERAHGSSWGPGRYKCNVCGGEFSRRDVEPKEWPSVTICPRCEDAIERGDVQLRMEAKNR